MFLHRQESIPATLLLISIILINLEFNPLFRNVKSIYKELYSVDPSLSSSSSSLRTLHNDHGHIISNSNDSNSLSNKKNIILKGISNDVPSDISELIRTSYPPIPYVYGNLADVQPISQSSSNEIHRIPFLWNIPRSGTGFITSILGECLGLTLASSFSCLTDNCEGELSQEQIFLEHTDTLQVRRQEMTKYLNVNLQTKEGIQRAADLGVVGHDHADSPLDVIVSPLVYDTAKLLFPHDNSVAQGRMFVMFRNPIEREVSNFFHVHKSIQNSDRWTDQDIQDYLQSSYFLDNIMVRSLVNKLDPSYQVTVQDLLVAKEILRRKSIVGLLEEKGSSWSRFKRFFESISIERQRLESQQSLQDGFVHPDRRNLYRADTIECEEKQLFWGWPNRNVGQPFVDHEIMMTKSSSSSQVLSKDLYEAIKVLNRWDMVLYDYARELFYEQEP